MKPFLTLTALVAPLDRVDVDTDAILPKQFLRALLKSGYGNYLFDAWRYRDPGDLSTRRTERLLNSDFALNQPRYHGAEILLCRRNFGCGSSREQAPWALRDYGFRALIAPSYGEIFYDNCLKNGLLPIVLAEPIVDRLFAAVMAKPGYRLTIDLPAQVVQTPESQTLPFNIDAFRKRCIIESLDDISYALAHADKIRAFEASRREDAPWVFGTIR
ncbi:MAG: 3-isopropylmalate dehydratase small subunit [candidate division NC10 bacterium]